MITYNKFFNKLNIVAALASVFIFSACNKELPEPIPNDFPLASASETVLKKLDAPEFSILKTAFLFYWSTFLNFIFARTNSITAGNKDTNIIATIRSFKFF